MVREWVTIRSVPRCLNKKELIAVNERAFVLSIRARFGGVLVLYFCFISVMSFFVSCELGISV